MSGRCAMLSTAACEIVDDRLRTSLKCSDHRSSMRLGSVSRLSASAILHSILMKTHLIVDSILLRGAS